MFKGSSPVDPATKKSFQFRSFPADIAQSDSIPPPYPPPNNYFCPRPTSVFLPITSELALQIQKNFFRWLSTTRETTLLVSPWKISLPRQK